MTPISRIWQKELDRAVTPCDVCSKPATKFCTSSANKYMRSFRCDEHSDFPGAITEPLHRATA